MTAILGYLLQRCCQAIYDRQQGILPNYCIRELGLMESILEDRHKDEVLMVMRVLFLESKVIVTKEAVSGGDVSHKQTPNASDEDCRERWQALLV